MDLDTDRPGTACPKCGHGMESVSYGGDLTIDRCRNCKSLWFDSGEAELLQSRWLGEALDTGITAEGRRWGAADNIACPRCNTAMEKVADPDQAHIWYEVCRQHGMFMDAGEFRDYKHETLADWFRSLVRGSR